MTCHRRFLIIFWVFNNDIIDEVCSISTSFLILLHYVRDRFEYFLLLTHIWNNRYRLSLRYWQYIAGCWLQRFESLIFLFFLIRLVLQLLYNIRYTFEFLLRLWLNYNNLGLSSFIRRSWGTDRLRSLRQLVAN